MGGLVAHQQAAAGRNDLHQAPEGLLQVLQVPIDVRVVELQAREDDPFRLVVEKLRPLVEEGAVVFVALHDHPGALPGAESAAEVRRDAADKKARVQPGGYQHPGHQ